MYLLDALTKHLRIDVRALLRDTGFSIGSRILTMLAGFLLVIVYARYLPPEVYGEYLFIGSWISVFSITGLVGMYKALSQAVAQGYEGTLFPIVIKKATWSLLGVGGMIATSFFYADSQPSVAHALLVMAPIVPFFYTGPIWQAFLEGKQRFSTVAYILVGIVAVKTGVILTAIFSYEMTSLYLLLANIGVDTLFHTIMLIYLLKKVPRKKVDESAPGYGIFISALNILIKIGEYLDALILGTFLGPVQLAIYGYAKFVPESIIVLMKSVENVLFPRMSIHSFKDITKKIKKVMPLLLAVNILVVIVAIILTPWVMQVAFDNRYNASIVPAQIITLGLLIAPFEFLYHQLILAHRQKKALTVVNIAKPTIKIVLTILFFYLWGFIGIIAMHVVARACYLVLYLFMMNHLEPTER